MTKIEIVDAAFRVWGRNFYRKTSLSRLAKELEVSKSALYRHFVNKKALLDAMTERFFDDFAASIRADYERAMQISEPDGKILAMIQGAIRFYARNLYTFIFSLMNGGDQKPDSGAAAVHLKSRGLDMDKFYHITRKEYAAEPAVTQLAFITMSFFMAHFYKIAEKPFEHTPSEDEIQKITADICEIIKRGLGFSAETIDALNFAELEKQAGETVQNTEPEPLFRAIAEAVAEAGPWRASMEMVASRLGLSKSSLYGHFKNRKDMLRRLFMSEFGKIVDFARQGFYLSHVPQEQLYLGIFSIVVYLRSRPELLVSMGWIRTRKLDLGKPEKDDFFRLFDEIDTELLRNAGEEKKRRISYWILFLIINILMRSGPAENEWNNNIRSLYRFITLGLKGFKQ
ncbi:MAG: TetR/AcrR family transcriptional regulator [Treponema sp.]|jgi:AcrR family transcriptional regulator|nr:TetR/AcrR family transcriptional regulator [Treponema sp.]